MENNPPPVKLWDGNHETPKSLRLPNTAPTNGLTKTENKTEINELSSTTSINNDDNKVVKSILSADAPEFYPSSYRKDFQSTPAASVAATTSAAVTSKNSVQDRLKRHKNIENDDNKDDFIDSPDDIRLRHLIDTLTKDPGQFDDLQDIFMDTIAPYYENDRVLSRAAQLLVKQAIDCPSFRYSAAKLCCCIESLCPGFRAELHSNCTKELETNGNKSGLLLFIAELYMSLLYENIYGSCLIDAFKHLLTIGGNENIKSICQALKLTGYSLDYYNKEAVDEVFVKLEQAKPTVTGTALSLIDSVIALRNSSWGHANNTQNDVNSSHQLPLSSSQEAENPYWGDHSSTVFYASDGSQLTREETEFLAGNMNSTEEYFTDTSDPDELCDPEPEMDEEIQAAFKDFVKYSKR